MGLAGYIKGYIFVYTRFGYISFILQKYKIQCQNSDPCGIVKPSFSLFPLVTV